MSEMNEDIQTNQRNWDDRVAGHLQPDGYDPERFVRDRSLISQTAELDREALGELRGKSLLHLQCHIGTDSLSLARLGAEVTGVDFSAKALAAARELSEAAGESVRYIECNIYDTPDVLEGQFDIVYTSVGTLGWLPDLVGWAKVVRHFLKPGGMFYYRDYHPIFDVLDFEREDDQLVCRYPYGGGRRLAFEHDASYSGSATLTHGKTVEWQHGLADILGALLGEGLQLEHIDELDYLQWLGLPCLVKGDDGLFRLPASQADRCPLGLRIIARG